MNLVQPDEPRSGDSYGSWLADLGEVENYVEPPSYHKFSYHEPDLEVTIRGTPDGVFKMRDGSYTIVDYKTAKYTPGQERLLPIYRAQLNGYAFLGNRLDLGPLPRSPWFTWSPSPTKIRRLCLKW